MARRSLSKRTRFEVFKRDDFQCQYCGARAPEALLHADHVVPKADGGSDEIDNLVTSCEGCNLGKGPKGLGDKSPPFDPNAPEVTQERADQIEAYRAAMSEWVEQRKALEYDVAVSVYDAIWGHEEAGKMLTPQDTKRAIRFIEQLGFAQVLDLAHYVGGKTHKFYTFHKAWRYFYACCRNRIRESDADYYDALDGR